MKWRSVTMEEIKRSEAIDRQRRRFFGAAALTIAAAEFGMTGSAGARPAPANLSHVFERTAT
jgi:hypothetical protein